MSLHLKPGPTLIWSQDGSGADSPSAENVTLRSHQYLFETVTLEEGVVLGDLFKLLDVSHILQALYRRNFCDELLAEARKGVAKDVEVGYSPTGIEYLELYQIWSLNTANKELLPVHRPEFQGVGYELKEDLDEGHGYVKKAGTRTHYSLSFTPLRTLLHLPVRIKQETLICEDDVDSVDYLREVQKVCLKGISLGQVLEGVLWELSFYGGPEESTEVRDILVERVAEARALFSQESEAEAGSECLEPEPSSFEALLAEGDNEACVLLFDSMGGHTPASIARALRSLHDDTAVEAGLQEALGSDVSVKQAHRGLSARAFRKLFREAKQQ